MIKTVLNEPVYDTDAVNKAYLDKKLASLYPVGSIYMNLNLIDPSLIFGDTWERLKDTFLLGAGDTYEAGTTGGEAEHILTIEEMPKHGHPENSAASSNTNRLVTTGTAGSKTDDNIYGKSQGSVMANQASWQTSAIIVGTGRIGEDKPHNNMPPYLTVYIWKRIA
jgi:hypothetical protein